MAFYKKFYNHYWNTRSESGNRFRYSIFLSWVDKSAKILDIGCGDGFLSSLLIEKKDCSVTGLDISEVAAEKAKARGVDVVVANVEEPLPFEDNSFDFVIATEVLEHITLSEELLLEMARVSRRYLLVSIPNSAFWKYRLQLLFGKFPKQWLIHPREHLRFWAKTDFKKTIKELGLQIENIKAGSGRRYLRDFLPNLFAEQICFKIKI